MFNAFLRNAFTGEKRRLKMKTTTDPFEAAQASTPSGAVKSSGKGDTYTRHRALVDVIAKSRIAQDETEQEIRS
jgi:hypothetical protein